MEKVPPFSAGENKSSLPLTSPLITHSVPQTFQQIDGANQPVLNNGINADGGLTSIYEQSVTSATPQGAPYFIYIASNGRKILFYTSTTRVYSSVYVQAPNSSTSVFVGNVSKVFSKRTLIPGAYSDVVLGSDDTILALRYDYITGTNVTNFYLDQLSISTLEILNTYTIQYNGKATNAKIAKANTLTYALIQSTSGFVFTTNTKLLYVCNGVINTIISTCVVNTYTADNLSAIWNAGILVAACPYNTTISSPGLYNNNTPSDYTSWSNLAFSGIQGVIISTIGGIIPSATILHGSVATYSKTTPIFDVRISAAGVVTTATQFATLFNSSGTSANFTMESGVTTPWGCSGIYSTSAAAPYGVFQKDKYKDNNPNTTIPIFAADLNTSPTDSVAPITLQNGTRCSLGVVSFKGNVSFISLNVNDASTNNIPVPINDIGASGADTDILTGNIFNSTHYNKCFIPPDYRSENSTGDTQGAGLIYKTNRGDFIYCQLAAGQINTNVINPQEIAPGVVKLNTATGNNQIIDTNLFVAYNNYSGFGMPILLNYTSITASLAYIRIYNKYSTSLDYGLLNVDPSITNMTAMFTYDYFKDSQYDVVLWDGATGAYISHIGAVVTTNACYSYYPGNAGTYVNNPSVPPGNDATYQGGAIIMPLSRAVQTPNYCGFLLPNLLSSAQYTDFFILKGTFYTYDGNFIYDLPLSSGVGSTISGVPQPLLTCQGLKFLDCSQSYAYFLDNFDNSIWAYSGGREISKLVILSRKPAILSGHYSDYDNTLYLTTASSIISMRDESSITENALPFASGTWNTYTTELGVYYVQGATSILRTYKNVTSSTLIPLNYQTGYLGYQSSSMFTVNRIKMKIACLGGLTSTLNLAWNWVTQDNSGTDTATITTSEQSASGYFTFEWSPPHNNVLLFSFGIADASGIQKLVLLNLDVYTTYVNEANISNKVP